jgi:hypothetical protein
LRSEIGTCLVMALLVGCSGDDKGDDDATGGAAPSTGGAQSPTGGTGTGGSNGGTATGGARTGGTSAGGTSAGSNGKGGASPTGGRATLTGGAGGRGGATTGGSGNPPGGGSGEAPSGAPETCVGDGCPLGECDNGRFFADERCSDVYPGPVDASSMYCATGSDDGYCLTVVGAHVDDWKVTCDGGIPTLTDCMDSGCGVSGGIPQCG